MGDRTYQQATVWQCPEDLARQVAEILGEYRNNSVDTTTALGIGSVYYIDGGSLGTAEETAAALVDLGQAIVAETSEDPNHGYLGDHYVVLGGEVTSMPCDSDGDDLVFVHDLAQVLSDDALSTEERFVRIEQLAQIERRVAIAEAKGTMDLRTILFPAEVDA
ncbi:MAG: hypothetical protein ACYCST_10110 [Acidimicrobiales bacterium]